MICKIDATAYYERVAIRERKANLENMLAQKRKQLEAAYVDEFYASKDGEFARLLEEYNGLCDIDSKRNTNEERYQNEI